MNFEELKQIRERIAALEKVDVVVSDVQQHGISFSVDSGFYTIQNLLAREDLQAIQAILNRAGADIAQVINARKDYLQFRFEKAEAALAALSDNLTPTPEKP